jgi:hypothetical protein
MKNILSHTIKKIQEKKLIFAIFFAFLISSMTIPYFLTKASTSELFKGYGSATNSGFISLSSKNNLSSIPYGFELSVTGSDPLNATASFDGYAWSPNIGWLSSKGGSSCGGQDISLNITDFRNFLSTRSGTIRINGFGKFVSGESQNNTTSGGWDGCVSFQDTTNTNAFGVSLVPDAMLDTTGKQCFTLSGNAWAANRIGTKMIGDGIISFSQNTGSRVCIDLSDIMSICTDPNTCIVQPPTCANPPCTVVPPFPVFPTSINLTGTTPVACGSGAAVSWTGTPSSQVNWASCRLKRGTAWIRNQGDITGPGSYTSSPAIAVGSPTLFLLQCKTTTGATIPSAIQYIGSQCVPITQCNDGLDNDGDGTIDSDGGTLGASLADQSCMSCTTPKVAMPSKDSESGSCQAGVIGVPPQVKEK